MAERLPRGAGSSSGSGWRRPASIAEISRRTLQAGGGADEFDYCCREFLDEFYYDGNAARRSAMLAERPAGLSEKQDAMLSGLAAHLAQVYRLPEPAWCEEHGRSLKRPVYAGGLESTKAWLLAVSPPAFRERMIFIAP